MSELSDIRIENGVIIGEGDELFLASERHDTLDLITGKVRISAASLKNFKDNLQHRRELCSYQGIKYLHLVAPDKHTVYRASFPLKDFRVLGDYYRQRTEAEFLFPVEYLQNLPYRTYGRTDTHWSSHGRIAIAGQVALGFGLEATDVESRLAELHGQVVSTGALVAGDLGGRFTPPRTEAPQEFKPSWKTHAFSNGVTQGNHGRINVVISRHPGAKGRLVVFGDSFMAQTLPALSAFFAEILFFRTRYFHKEIISTASPDFVLTENVERYFSVVESDEQAPPVLLMAALMGRSARYEGDNVKAIAGLLSARTSTPYKALCTLLTQRELVVANS